MRPKFNPFLPAATAVCIALSGPVASGATAIKQNNGTNDLSSTAAGVWLGGSGANGSPTTSDIAQWTGASSTGAHTCSANVSWLSLQFTNTLAADTTFSGSQITLNNNDTSASAFCILNDAARLVTINNNITFAASGRHQITSNAGTLTIAGTINGNGTLWLRGSSANSVASGAITCTTLTKADSGTWSLTQANTISSGTTISGGTLSLGNDGALGSTTISIGNGTAGTCTGTLGVVANSGPRTLANNITISGLTGNTLAVNTANGNITLNGNITDSGSLSLKLTKINANTLTLGGANNYSGGTTLTQSGDSTGIIVAKASALGTGTVLVNGGQQYSSSIQVNDNLSVANALTLKRGASGSGRAILGLGSGSTWSGAITVDNTSTSGIACIIAGGTTAASASIVSGNIGYSTLGTGNSLVLRGSYYGKVTGSVSLSTGTVQLLDGSKWEFSNTSNTWGTLDVSNSGAIVTVGAANTLSSSGVVSSTAGGTLQLNNQAGTTAYSQTIAGLNGNVKVGLTTGTATLTLNTAADKSTSGAISGAISLTKTGSATQTLSGTNTYTGATTVSAGTLLVSGALGNTAVEVKTGGKLVNNGSLGGTVTTDTTGIVTGNGSFAGAATINGTLSPGNSPGYQSFGGGLVLGSASNSIFEIGGTSRSTLLLTGNSYYDAIDVTGGLTLDGTINVTWFNGFTAANGNTFNLFNVISGGINASNFDVTNDLSLPSLASGLTWDTSTFASNGTITVVPEPRAALLGGLGLLALLRRRRN